MGLTERLNLIGHYNHLYGGHKFDIFTNPVGQHLDSLLERLSKSGIVIQPSDCKPRPEEAIKTRYHVSHVGETIFPFKLKNDEVEIEINEYHSRTYANPRAYGGDVSLDDGIKCVIIYNGPEKKHMK